MTKYELTYETKDNGDYLFFWDGLEAETEYFNIIEDENTINATLTEFYIYGGMCQGEKVLHEYKRATKTKDIYEAYASANDITFILEDTFDEDGEIISTECVGWYYGEPSEDDTKRFYGKLKGEYID